MSKNKEKEFEPVLFPNESIDISDIKGVYMVSNKFDGQRCLFINGEMKSRKMKPMPNFRLIERFEVLREYSAKTGITLDGELYSHDLSFQDLEHFFKTIDTCDEEIPESIKFYCFEVYDPSRPNLTAEERYDIIKSIDGGAFFIPVKQELIVGQEAIKQKFEEALSLGYEGIMLKSPQAPYKFGRYTVKEGYGYKVKKFVTTDGKIVGVEQATKVDPNAVKKIDELGKSVTSKKKGDRILIEKASSFIVEYEDITVKVPLKMTDSEKKEVWKNKDSYIGRWVEYKYQEEGMDKRPRIPIYIRMRPDKDD